MHKEIGITKFVWCIDAANLVNYFLSLDIFSAIQHNETVKEKLGKPTIDYENGRVDYCEQTFDDFHIFSFEFYDDNFEDLQYFSIDG